MTDQPSPPPPGDPWAPVEVLDTGVAPAPQRRGGRGVAVVASVAVAAVLVGGASLAWAAFSGGGDQPEQHLPASTAALLKVDFDPSGEQKIDAVRFFSKFPGSGGLEGSGDPRRWLYERVTKGVAQAPSWSEVEPWLGQRAAVGVLPGDAGGEPVPVVVLQVTDEAKAKATLAKAPARDTAFTVAGGWATLSDTRAHVDAATSGAASGTLAADANFRHDTEALGDTGVLAGWADLTRLPQVRDAARLGLPSVTALAGTGDVSKQRLAMVARFTGGNAEVTMRTVGPQTLGASSGTAAAVAALPADTVAAVGLGGGGEAVRSAWKAFGDALGQGDAGAVLGQAEEESGMRLPDDLSALLGQRAVLALGAPDASDRPVVGLRAASDATGLDGALDRLLRFTDSSKLPLVRRDVPGGYVLSTAREHAAALAKDGGLGGTEAFKDAVRDAGDAQFVAYVDVQALTRTYARDVDGDTAATLKALRAVGLRVGRTGDGAELTLRVTTR